MTDPSGSSHADFDAYASNYDAALDQGIAVSGEGKEYFAQGRVAWLSKCLAEFGERPLRVMDYGCGTGSATPFFLKSLRVDYFLGIDSSLQSLRVGRQKYGSENVRFSSIDDYKPLGEMDLVFCNGVFHHIPVNERPAVVNYIFRSLRPGGLFAFWENNPLNPGTRYIMSRIPFDRDAVTLRARNAQRLLAEGGFDVMRMDFLFIFPNVLRWLRGIEPAVSRLPLGAQYQVLCRKP